MAEGGRPVPAALLRALDRWDEQGRPEQPASAWSLRSWQAFLPQHAEYIASLPNPINRAEVRAEVVGASDTPDDAVRAFVATMVWAHGRVGYGAYRTAKVLADNPGAAEVLMEVAAEPVAIAARPSAMPSQPALQASTPSTRSSTTGTSCPCRHGPLQWEASHTAMHRPDSRWVCLPEA